MRKAIVHILLCHLCFLFRAGAQDMTYVDSLKGLLATALNDSIKADLLVDISNEYRLYNLDTAKAFANRALALAEKKGYKKVIARAYNSLGSATTYSGDYSSAIELHKKSLKIREEIGDKRGVAGSYNNIGSVYYFLDNYPEALKYYFLALKMNEESGNKLWEGYNRTGIGLIYTMQGNYSEALKYLQDALRLEQEMQDRYGYGDAYANIGEVYDKQGDLEQALINYYLASGIFEENKDSMGMANVSINIGNVYLAKKKYHESLKMFLKSAKLSERIDHRLGLAEAYLGISTVYFNTKKYKDAGLYLEKNMDVAKELGTRGLLQNSYKLLARLDSAKGHFNEALAHYKIFITYRDSIHNSENAKTQVALQMQYDFDKKESAAKAEQDIKDAVTAKQLQTQKYVRNGFMGGFGIVLLFAGVFFRQRNRIKNANTLILKEKENAEQQRIRAEQSEKFKQQFLANMSHEIRTPMNAVLGMTNLLIDKSPRPDQHEYLDGIQKSSDTLLHIINDILDLSKIEEGKMELEQIDFPIHDLVDQVRQTLNYKAEEKGLHLITEIDKSIPEIMVGDPNRLKQVLINLAGNAIKFTEKGSVSLKVSSEQLEVSSSQSAVCSRQTFVRSFRLNDQENRDVVSTPLNDRNFYAENRFLFAFTLDTGPA